MKPREFDDLIRQKFDQNDFEYNPGNWARLEEQLEGKPKKRTILMWWVMPLMGVAASVAAFAIGINFMWRQAATGDAGVAGFSLNIQNERKLQVQEPQGVALQYATQKIAQDYKPRTHKNKINNEQVKEENFGIKLQDALSFTPTKAERKFNLLDNPVAKKDEKKKEPVAAAISRTFKPELEQKAKGLTILLSGGVNQGNQNSGYVGGATIRKMVSKNVYIESDVAFVSSSYAQSQTDMVPVYSRQAAARQQNIGAKITKTTDNPIPDNTTLTYLPKSVSDNYSLSYAQISPSIGVQIIKKISIAAGPDFQQILAETKPATTPAADQPFNNISVLPSFDMGLIGKTEYSVTNRIKAQFSYRKGINNMLTPGDKYLDRDYMQVQVRCAIFNK